MNNKRSWDVFYEKFQKIKYKAGNFGKEQLAKIEIKLFTAV